MTTQAQIRFGIYDTTAQEDASYSSVGMQPFVDYDILKEVGFAPADYATSELNMWLLNEEQAAAPDDLSEGRWAIVGGSLSGSDRVLAQPTQLVVSFEHPHTSIGLTIFGDEALGIWATRIHIAWNDQHGGTMLEKEYAPSSARFFAEGFVDGYYGVTLTFLELNKPGVFLRLNRLDYGIEHVFAEDELQGASIVEELSPVSECLVESQLNFSSVSMNEDFSILSPRGVFTSLQTGQRMDVTIWANGERKSLGLYYLEEWNSPSDIKSTFKGVDMIGMLGKREYAGDLFSEQPLLDIVAAIFDPIGVDVHVHPGLSGVHLAGWIPYSTYRDALQCIAFASCAVAISQGDGSIMLQPLPNKAVSTIGTGRKIIGRAIEQRKEYTNVEVAAYDFQSGVERREISKSEYLPGTFTVAFRAPTHDIACSGATIVDVGANHVTFTVDSAQEVIISGIEFLQSQTIYSIVRDTPLAGGMRTSLRADRNTMVSRLSVVNVADNVFSSYALPRRLNFRCLLRDERIGDFVRVFVADNAIAEGNIVKLTSNLVGYLADVEIVGGVINALDGDSFQRVNAFYAGVRGA